MKTMIIYASKYGYTKDCAEKLKEKLTGEVFVANVKTDKIPAVDSYDTVIIGGSIYMGRLNKKLKLFINKSLNSLLKKRLALFLCCGSPESFEATIKNAFPEEMLKKAISVECFGGELNPDKMKGLDKMITRAVKKSAAKEGKPDAKPMPENIEKMANAING